MKGRCVDTVPMRFILAAVVGLASSATLDFLAKIRVHRRVYCSGVFLSRRVVVSEFDCGNGRPEDYTVVANHFNLSMPWKDSPSSPVLAIHRRKASKTSMAYAPVLFILESPIAISQYPVIDKDWTSSRAGLDLVVVGWTLGAFRSQTPQLLSACIVGGVDGMKMNQIPVPPHLSFHVANWTTGPLAFDFGSPVFLPTTPPVLLGLVSWPNTTPVDFLLLSPLRLA